MLGLLATLEGLVRSPGNSGGDGLGGMGAGCLFVLMEFGVQCSERGTLLLVYVAWP